MVAAFISMRHWFHSPPLSKWEHVLLVGLGVLLPILEAENTRKTAISRAELRVLSSFIS